MTSRRLSAGGPCGGPGKEQSIGHRLCLSRWPRWSVARHGTRLTLAQPKDGAVLRQEGRGFGPSPTGSPIHAGGFLLHWVQIALKPASKAPGLHGVFICDNGLKFVFADSTLKRMRVGARACWLHTGEHHPGLALRTSGALNCNEWNGGQNALILGHDASLE